MDAAQPLVLDPEVLEELRQYGGENGGTLLDDLLKLYLETAPDSLEVIRAAIVDGDAKRLEAEAHRLKSSCGNLGAMSLHARCQVFERLGASGNLTEAAGALADFSAEYERVLLAMRAQAAAEKSR